MIRAVYWLLSLWRGVDVSSGLGERLVRGFLESSVSCLEPLLGSLSTFKQDVDRTMTFYRFEDEQKTTVQFDRNHFFLRASTEYSNPQLTVEDVQGIVAARVLEACTCYFEDRKVGDFDSRDVTEICELLRRPPSGKIVPFLLNTDDVEPDRYSINPLRRSFLRTGQSAFPAASVDVEGLEVDEEFFSKYEGTLISRKEVDLIQYYLDRVSRSYVDFADMVKYDQLRELSAVFEMDLCLPSLRLPLQALADEAGKGVITDIIEDSHRNYESVEKVYAFMGRSMKNRTTLLAVPHSEKGLGSKRAARGKLYFKDDSLTRVKVRYRTTPLYPNAIDPEDVSVAEGNESFVVDGNYFRDYDYSQTPSSPQFVLYSLASPEDGCIWHSVGAWGARELVRSYTSTHYACYEGRFFKDLVDNSRLVPRMPVQLNLIPRGVWAHPVHRNIDASIGCVEDLNRLVEWGMWIEHLAVGEYVRR